MEMDGKKNDAGSQNMEQRDSTEMTEIPIGAVGLEEQAQILPVGSGNNLDKRKPVVLEFKNLVYKVPVKNKERQLTYKTILSNVSGIAKPGELLAIMGPSGSGKSTLLSILCGSIPRKCILEGSVTANGRRLGRDFTKKIAGVVLQDDLLYSNLSVLETVRFSAYLRLPNKLTKAEKDERVEATINELGLRKVRETLVGGELVRGVSGGERKRVSIASELVRDVSVLMLDEPTSGLDSFMAYNVMQSLRELARDLNVTIIATIHQPRSQIWGLFDSLLLLSEGKTMYFGPQECALEHFKEAGFPCPSLFNPTDHFMDVVSVDYRSHENEARTKAAVNNLHEFYTKKEHLYLTSANEASEEDAEDEILSPGRRKSELVEFAATASYSTQFHLLFLRSFRQVIRDKFATVIRFFQTLFFAFLIGGIYFNLSNTQQSIQDRNGLLFFMVINQAFGAMFGVLSRFPVEKPIFIRETAQGFYTPAPYYVAKMVAELPLTLLFPMINNMIVYLMTGLNPQFDKFIIFNIAIWLGALSSESVGLVAGAIAPNVMVANLIGPLITIVFLLVGGFYINSDSIPAVFQWIEAISYIKYSYRILSVNEFSGLTFTCRSTSEGCLKTGEEVLDLYGQGDASVAVDIFILIAIVAGLRFIAYLFLRLGRPKMKRV